MKNMTLIATIIATSLFVQPVIAHELGDHLPKKGQPTAVQLQFGGDIAVTKDNFIAAESDKYFFEQQQKSGINHFTHDRVLLTMDTQTVVRQNRDTLYSKSIWDTQGGLTFTLPVLDSYQSLQVIDENHRTVAVLYAQQGKNQITVTPDMLSHGQHVWVVARTQVASDTAAAIAEGNRKQDLIKADASSATLYQAKGFNQYQREQVRLSLENDVLSLDFTKAMGAPEGKPIVAAQNVEPRQITQFHARGLTAMGFGGLPSEHAYYKVLLAENRDGQCQKMNFDAPPLQDNGFFSITTYGEDAYVHTDNFALSSRQGELEANTDGSYTVHFNCGDNAINNIDVEPNWTGILRMYKPVSEAEIVDYAKGVALPH
ncbi:DUF1254 domain-containing protein [Shewanella sp. Scap07]|uniref:DUF1254 domain-containing protein n=1 Tax=Shewanella sp. Scap07 TaxID=2589987 RepID=UPI0015BDD2B9|nr:DUF1254 domain-containing protein [Shewanella sp. Scap07]QLE86592.1 DUF1254 domain-containing protein [Shewanella sp. Scap07]